MDLQLMRKVVRNDNYFVFLHLGQDGSICARRRKWLNYLLEYIVSFIHIRSLTQVTSSSQGHVKDRQQFTLTFTLDQLTSAFWVWGDVGEPVNWT